MGVWIAVGAVVVGVVFGLYRKVTDGRFKPVAAVATESVAPAKWHGYDLGERATLVQFSSAFCAPCRTTRVILADVASGAEGIVHLDIDAEAELDLVRELNILRTPTTVILDADGREITRAAGAPRKDQVLAALAAL